VWILGKPAQKWVLISGFTHQMFLLYFLLVISTISALCFPNQNLKMIRYLKVKDIILLKSSVKKFSHNSQIIRSFAVKSAEISSEEDGL
jgi:hypothetical protein